MKEKQKGLVWLPIRSQILMHSVMAERSIHCHPAVPIQVLAL
jgi:hypothetical protein